MTDVYSHPDYLAFVASMRAAPDDDLPRLACADWLQDRGEDARAEFVRVQCELSRTDWRRKFPDTKRGRKDAWKLCDRHSELRRRERELQKFWREWVGPAAMKQIPNGALYYDHTPLRRGFVESVTCTAADWLAHADAILAAHPVTAVKLTTRPEPPGFEYFGTDGRTRRRTYRIAGQVFRYYGLTHAELLAKRWPGVTFELPPAYTVDGNDLNAVTDALFAPWTLP